MPTNNVVNFEIDFGTKTGERQALALYNFLQKKFGSIDLKFNSKGPNGLGAITSDLSNFEKSLDAAAARVVAFTATTSLIYSFANALKRLATDSISVEKQLNGIQAILQTSPQNLQKFSQGLFQIANQNSIAFDDAAKAANEFARQGLNLEKTLQATDAALKLSKISQVEVTKAVEDLTAAVSSFSNEGLDYVDILDKLVAVDANFAISSGGLVEGIKRVGSVASEAGVSIDQLNGLLAAVKQTTGRSSAVIANGFKSIFVSLQDARIQEKLEQVGVATRDAFGNFRSQFDILDDLADKFGKLSDAQQAQITKLVAGKFQANTFSATLKVLAGDTNLVTKAIEVSANASGDAQKRIEILGNTTASSIQKFQNSLTQLNATIGKTLVNPIIDNFAKSFSNVFDAASAGLNEDNFAGIGNTIGKSILKGLVDTISGPGLVLAVTTLGKLIIKTATDLAKISKNLLDLGKTRGQSTVIEKNISNEIVTQNKQYQNQLRILSQINSQRNSVPPFAARAPGNAIPFSGRQLSSSSSLAAFSSLVARGSGATGTNASNFNLTGTPIGIFGQRNINKSLISFAENNKSLSGNILSSSAPVVLSAASLGKSVLGGPIGAFPKDSTNLQGFLAASKAAEQRKIQNRILAQEAAAARKDAFSGKLLGASFAIPFATGAVSNLFGGDETRTGRTISNLGRSVGSGLSLAALAGGGKGGFGLGSAFGAFQFFNEQSKNKLDFPRLSSGIDKVIESLDKQVNSLNAFNQAATKAEELLNSGAPLSVRLRAQSQVSDLAVRLDPKLKSVLLNPNSTEEQKQLASLDFSESISRQQNTANFKKLALNLSFNQDQRRGFLPEFTSGVLDIEQFLKDKIGFTLPSLLDIPGTRSSLRKFSEKPNLGKDELKALGSTFLDSLGGIGELRKNPQALDFVKNGNLEKAVLLINGRDALDDFSAGISQLNERSKEASIQLREYIKEFIKQEEATADILNRRDKLKAVNIPLKDIVDKIAQLRFSDAENAAQNRADRFNSNVNITNALLNASSGRISESDLAIRQAGLKTERLQFGRASELNSALRSALGPDVLSKIQANTSDPQQLLNVLGSLSENFDIQELGAKLDKLVSVGEDSKESITKELINVRPALISAIKSANSKFDVQSKEVKELLNIQLEEIKRGAAAQTFGSEFLRNGGAGKFSDSLIAGNRTINETPEQIRRRQERLANARTLGGGINARAIAAENERRGQNALSVLTKNENFRNAINFESLSPELQNRVRASTFNQDQQAIFDLRKSEQSKAFLGPIQQQIDFVQSLSKGKFTSISGGQEKNIINSILSGNPQGALNVLNDPRLNNISDVNVKSGLEKLKELISVFVEIDKNTDTAAKEEASRLNKSGGTDLNGKLAGLGKERAGLLATETQSGELLTKTQALVDSSNALVSYQEKVVSLLEQTVEYNKQRIKLDTSSINKLSDTFTEEQFNKLGEKLETGLKALGESLSSSLSGRSTTSSSNLDVNVDVSGNVRSTFDDPELIKTIQYNIAEAMRAALGSVPIFKPVQR